MEKLDGDEVRLSSRGVYAERDIVQVRWKSAFQSLLYLSYCIFHISLYLSCLLLDVIQWYIQIVYSGKHTRNLQIAVGKWGCSFKNAFENRHDVMEQCMMLKFGEEQQPAPAPHSVQELNLFSHLCWSLLNVFLLKMFNSCE